ncbi:MAG: NUDIX domain-containing protein [Bacteroidetes bacterium]|nr:NUDIX domain-containing protein [Bacteroidota bacterium]
MQKIIAAGGLVINEKQEILMMYRRQHWDLPKGKLDADETIELCAVREVKEEVGLKEVTIVNFLCKTHHIYFDKWLQQEVEKETWWYLMKANTNEQLIPQTEEDIEKVIWANELQLKECLQNTYLSIVEVVEVYKKCR